MEICKQKLNLVNQIIWNGIVPPLPIVNFILRKVIELLLALFLVNARLLKYDEGNSWAECKYAEIILPATYFHVKVILFL